MTSPASPLPKALPHACTHSQVAGGIVPVYNIPVLDEAKGEILVVDRTVLAYIFIGNISMWNDERILNLQSSAIRAKLEAAGQQPIQIIVRKDGSGSTEVMTKSFNL